MSARAMVSTFVCLLMLSICFQPLAAAGSEEGGRAGPSTFPADPVTYTKPANFAELVGWYKALEAEYPNYLRVWKANEDYGHGQIVNRSGMDPYDYWMVRITNESLGFKKPEVLFIGTPHGDETVGPVGQYWFTDWLMRHALTDDYNTTEDDWLNWVLDHREIYLAVCHNPDGFDRYTSPWGRFDGNGYDLNRQADYDHVPNSGTYNTGPAPWVTVNGKTMRDFVNDHQVRVGADHHGGVRMLLYAWSSSHSSISGTSQKTSETYSYAPPDFDYFDISSLRVGDFIGDYGGDLDKDNIGPVPPTVGYAAPGGILSWAYGGDVLNATAEDSHVQDETFGNYKGSGILWLSPEWSTTKNADESTFGSDVTPGYGAEVRRFILHQTDLAQPYVYITKDSIANHSVVNAGENITFLWKVNGCLVVDDTYIQFGTDPDPVNHWTNTTTHRDMYKGQYWGGSGWENANAGNHQGYTHGQTFEVPDEIGDYYFVIRAMVDQVYANVTGSSEYGDESYLRLIKERTDPTYTETLQGADGLETIQGRQWWYSDIIHIKVVKKPEVVDFYPADGAEWVPTDVNISVEFDLGMDETVTEAAFSIDPPAAGAFHWDANSTNITLDPDGPLASETTYTLTVDTSALSLLDTVLEEDFSFSFTTAFSDDVIPPYVTGSDPVDGAQEVRIDTQVRISFSEDMDTVATGGAFGIVPSITGDITWENGTSTMVFTPDEYLDGPKDYICSVGTAAMDLGRNHLASMYSFDFRTEVPDKVRPYILDTGPHDGDTMVPLDTNISVLFSEAMKASNAEEAFNISPYMEGNFSWSPDGMLMTFDPVEDLTPEAVFTVTVADTATDLYLNPLEEGVNFTFTALDITPPRVVGNFPLDGDVNVSIDIDITVDFSEPMWKPGLSNSIHLYPEIVVAVTTAENGTRVIIGPEDGLEYSTRYTVTVTTDAVDLNQLPLEEEHTFSFTTRDPPDLTPPSVVSTTPDEGETNVSVWAGVAFELSEEVVAVDIGAKVAVAPAPHQPFDVVLEGTTVKLLPAGSSLPWLADRTGYTVTLSGSIMDLAGNIMGSDFDLRFETGYAGPPTVTGSTPVGGSEGHPVGDPIIITFSRPMDPGSVKGAFSITPSVDGTYKVDGNDTLTFSPNKPLKPGTRYTVRVTTAASDELGNHIEDVFTLVFRTERKDDAQGFALEGMFPILLMVLVVIAVLVVLAVALRRRKGGSTTTQPPPTSQSPPPGGTTPGPPMEDMTEGLAPTPPSEPEPQPQQQPEPQPEPELRPEPQPEPQTEAAIDTTEAAAPEGGGGTAGDESLDDLIKRLDQ